MQVPFFRPSITATEIAEVEACLRSGWLTSGALCRRFEEDFAAAVGSRFAVAVNSCTAALHLAVEALGLRPQQVVLVPTMTFAATAMAVCHQGAVPLFVDCDPVTCNLNLADAEKKLADLKKGRVPLYAGLTPVGIMPVHVGGLMMDMEHVRDFARRHQLWIVEDAAHAFPAAYRAAEATSWRRCGENTADVSCFSFYANKTITTGEGGMAVTEDPRLADCMRRMSKLGLSSHICDRSFGNGSWDYQIVAPGFKYNLSDIAAALGIQQLRRSQELQRQREAIARKYLSSLADCEQIELPPLRPDRIQSWHLFPIRLKLERLRIDRRRFLELLWERGVSCSVHWRPLHLHAYFQEIFGWRPEDFPVASEVWMRSLSLPLFPDMRAEEQSHVIAVIRDLCAENAIA